MKVKLTSRKFWIAVISIITGILGVMGAGDNAIQAVSSAGLILIPAITYIIAEGKIDASAASQIDLDALLEVIKKAIGNYASAETESQTETADK
ncbi:MAG: hypothetical protein Q8865_03940 [Bacillota bacterium]|nr:hypothetical protein [Bacillota bacterium]